MAYELKHKLVIAISSRALFDLENENQLFEKKGLKAYYRYQINHENKLLKRGAAFDFVKNILRINSHFDDKLIEVIVLSRNNAATGLRIQNSIEKYKLDIERTGWTSGTPIGNYLKAFNVDLFLSAHEKDVQEAINAGIAAARIIPKKYKKKKRKDVRIAFDGDAVLFSDESEKIYQKNGLEAFVEHERKNANKPLPKGPFAKLLKVISHIQKRFPMEQAPIKTSLITARNFSTFKRVIRTFDAWSVHIDEAFFLGGIEKHRVIKSFKADIFFDDQDVHLEKTSYKTPSAKVPYKQ
ncbi:MAG: 5'-nucleotidase [Sulfurovum sp.]|nr:5'-nucleotidase [Sulfurovum sp.]MCB4748445.1 5'-nucleotidase [Sulfurovum sp.]MCB4752610.1 5'-nucleotidase [Sulfurovum sp.]MCB4761471.1 5'-nucleotidase [Sulfurovum sp.]MCB4763095.1 5'-nucleotidase [Sulfurovum sp.]